MKHRGEPPQGTGEKFDLSWMQPPPPPPDSRTVEPSPNSMLFWFPKVAAAGLPVPRTEMVRFDNRTMWPAMDGRPIPDVPWEEFAAAARRIGFPCFLRGDSSSAKHAGPDTYKVPSVDPAEGFYQKILNTFEDNCLKDLDVHAMVFREFLDLEATFTAFGFGGTGHPIANERRFFATAEAVLCDHFYWPAEAIQDHDPSVPDWRERLQAIDHCLPDERDRLATMAVEAVRALGDTREWSVDFARDKNGKWWLIDMALGRMSWHPAHDE